MMKTRSTLFFLNLLCLERVITKSTRRLYDQEDEKRAVEAIAAAAQGEVNESRSTARAQHNGHGIFSETWVNGDGGDDEAMEGEEAEKEVAAAGATAAAEDGAAATRTPKPVKRFKPIGAATPVVEFRWKTAEEEEAEELVADLVANAIANVVAAAECAEKQSME